MLDNKFMNLYLKDYVDNFGLSFAKMLCETVNFVIS